MTVTTESGGRQNAFPNETRPYIDETADNAYAVKVGAKYTF